ncbi:tail fiber assembly protein [Serratia inhibens]|uniref:tail fiber assembly protein n=1 Tax=Serratia inhibens TaxID=2338073 RepID=UPI003C7992D3
MNIKHIDNPRTKALKSYIDIDITLEDGSIMPFTATPNDSVGSVLYTKAMRGSYGNVLIAPGAGHHWDGFTWVAPSKEALMTAVEREKKQRMAVAEAAIAPLERAVRLGIATEEEQALLTAWETYSVLLSRAGASTAPDIDWPPVPNT